MPVDAALRSTFRNFFTLFLLVAVWTVPLHLAHSYAYRDVISIAELHPDLETFPEGRRVRNVGVGDLRSSRRAYLLLTVLELALLPLLLRAARRVVADGTKEPTVVGAYRGLADRLPARRDWGELALWAAAAAAFALAAGALFRAGGLLAVAPLPDERAFPWVGLVDATARALAGALFIGPIAYLRGAGRT
jgi:hypothetical protein